MSARAPPRAAPIRCAGGSTFAEAPDRIAPEARIIWHADLDPGTLVVAAHPAHPADPDAIRLAELAPWLAIATDPSGGEHAVLSDGWRHIRLDVEAGRLAGAEAVLLHYRLHGTVSAERRILPLRRLLDLCRHRRFARALFPRERRMERLLTVLRVHDALADGASQREIGTALFGEDHVHRDWSERSDSLRSRVRRLVHEARVTARGGYRQLLRRGR
ncbi:hypothetical protein GCM10011515_00180 [Tsuneonella deserti]|uniref:T6SS Transcription factor RovC-like DNA binding domain-containing protein n=2 Tax=Tsuneonella deserti TaxID=2035528 RepID=A0ABQ1RZM7_9SPHN|nr:hypothetical protein GCM10011515_00180 [Tsuneonella deserti]